MFIDMMKNWKLLLREGRKKSQFQQSLIQNAFLILFYLFILLKITIMFRAIIEEQQWKEEINQWESGIGFSLFLLLFSLFTYITLTFNVNLL